MFNEHPVPRATVRRFCKAFPCLMVLAGCTIEPTPQQYIDRQAGAAEQIALSEAELAERLSGLPDALARRDVAELRDRLRARPEGRLILPDGPAGAATPTTLPASLERLLGGREWLLADLHVTAGPQNNVAWFIAAFRAADPASSPPAFYLSGTFQRQEGAWLLAQAHLSTPTDSASAAVIPPPASPP